MRSLLFAFTYSLLSLGATAIAAPAPTEISLAELSPAELKLRVEKLKSNADRFANNKSVQRQFQADSNALIARLDGQSNFAQFNKSDQVEIVNAYESLRARALAGDASRNRRVCERVHRTGSHRVQTICLTQEERDLARKGSTDSLIQVQRRSPKSLAADQ